MTTLLDPIFINDSQLFRAQIFDVDGITAVTPLSCVCSIFNRTTGATIVSGAAGNVGTGTAQYNWSGSATAGEFEAVLTVTITAGVVATEAFRVEVKSKPQTFTTDVSTAIGQVRMELGDDVQGQGVKPDGRNLSDAEIQTLIDREGSVLRAVASACELLARQWARVANVAVGSRREDLSDVAKQWTAQAKTLREQYGGAEGSVTAFSVGVKRNDGWSQAADAGEFSS